MNATRTEPQTIGLRLLATMTGIPAVGDAPRRDIVLPKAVLCNRRAPAAS